MPGPSKLAQKAYHDLDFLDSAEARPLRILAEFFEPLKRFRDNNVKGTIVFFGSSRILPENQAKARLRVIKRQVAATENPTPSLWNELRQAENLLSMSKYYTEALKLAKEITLWSKSLTNGKRFVICSGGGPGIMEAANRGATEAHGKSLGLNISLPKAAQPSNRYISPGYEFEFHYFFMRKWWFIYLARAMVVFPGGYGTMDELMEVLTLCQTGKIPHKFPILLFGREYWERVVDLNFMVEMGTISKRDARLFRFVDSAEEALDYLKRTVPKTKEAAR